VAGYGISQGVGTLKDRSDHGQSNTDLSDAEVRGTWLGLTADSLSMFAVGSALRLGKGGLGLVDEVGTVGKALSIGAQYADTAAIGNSTVSLAQNWDRLTPQQQLASIGQLGFWATMTGVSAKQAGGFENLYGAKSIRESFGGKTEGLNLEPRQTGTGFFSQSSDRAYERIRESTTDVHSIAKNTGIKPSNIQKVKDHLFYEEHLLDRYVDLGIPAEMRRFDSDLAIANAWKRLENGTYTPSDLQLLRHEAAESYLMRRWRDHSYTRAHTRAQERFPAPQSED
jgi:hypothetical protein